MYQHNSQGVPAVGYYFLYGGDTAPLETGLSLADGAWTVESSVLVLLHRLPRGVGVQYVGRLALLEIIPQASQRGMQFSPGRI